VKKPTIPAFTRTLGPLLPTFAFFLAALTFLSIARLGLMAWKWDRLTAVDGFWPVLGYGLRMDTLLLSFLLCLPAVISLALPNHDRLQGLWRRVLQVWLTASAVMLAFMEVVTPSFISEYDSRPNRLFFEYLDHPFEVFATLWGAYKLSFVLGLVILALAAWGGWRLSHKLIQAAQPWSSRRRLAVFPLVALLIFSGARSSLDHRPANMSTAAFCNDPLINQLGVSSTYSLCYAIYRMHDESDSVRAYGKMSEIQAFEGVRGAMNLPPAAFDSADVPTLHHQVPLMKRSRPLNLVIIMEESLGAKYVKSLGGLPMTPELEKLALQGLWFSQLYATGTRSVRGLEAVVTGFPPTPSRSVVKLGLSQHNFFTLGQLLKEQGYGTEFIYGGDSQFDNMRAFLLGNGFDRVIDENDFTAPIFHGTWGVSDEDIFNRTHQELLSHGDKPFFTVVFSVSNHSPYEFPDGRIALNGQPKATRNNVVRYADYSLGQFFKKAKSAPYWKNTLFLVVADHEDQVNGSELVPVRLFHIPGLILGADIKPGRYAKVASQIDLAPTLLSLMGIAASHPMQGQDLLQTPSAYPGRAVMQFDNNQAYMVGDQVVIHSPNKPASYYTLINDSLKPASPHPALAREALAQATWPIFAYKNRLYHL